MLILLAMIESGKVKTHIAAAIALVAFSFGAFFEGASGFGTPVAVTGAMGKTIDAQSIVVASTATNWFGHEGSILRFVFKHSIALACLVGIFAMLQAYVFTGMIVHP